MPMRSCSMRRSSRSSSPSRRERMASMPAQSLYVYIYIYIERERER